MKALGLKTLDEDQLFDLVRTSKAKDDFMDDKQSKKSSSLKAKAIAKADAEITSGIQRSFNK